MGIDSGNGKEGLKLQIPTPKAFASRHPSSKEPPIIKLQKESFTPLSVIGTWDSFGCWSLESGGFLGRDLQLSAVTSRVGVTKGNLQL
jgi:hypothetical protein